MRYETIDIRELKASATQVVQAVREEGAEFVVTLHGRPVAVIRPYTAEDDARLRHSQVDAHLTALQALADEVGTAWQSPKRGVELVEEQRRS